MEGLKPGHKKRVLPSWMTTRAAEKRAVPVKTPRRRTATGLAAAAAARPPAVETVYCMNEAEMVDVALGVLIEVQKQEESRKQLSLAGTTKPRLSPPCSLSPHTSSGDEEEDSEKDAPSPGLSPSQGPGGSDSAHNTSPKEEEDVLKYVREIFFS